MFRKGGRLNSRSGRGQAIADGVVATYTLFIGLALPLMSFATLGYRAMLAYYATRDSCYQAAKSATFTLAKSNASTAFSNDSSSFTGVSGTETIYIVTQPLAGGAQSLSSTKLSSVDTSTNVYFIRAVNVATIQPVFGMGSRWIGGISIPGLTGSYNTTFACQSYVENPQGLTN